MLNTLRNPTFRHLFAAQIVALLGTGLATVALGLVAVLRIWPAQDIRDLAHDHPDLPPDHPHLTNHAPRHSHAFVIDDIHPRWPRAV